jgi:hypothetical protein
MNYQRGGIIVNRDTLIMNFWDTFIEKWGGRILRGVILIVWMCLLLWFGALTATGEAPEIVRSLSQKDFFIYKISNNIFGWFNERDGNADTPSGWLQDYLDEVKGPKPPISYVLASLQKPSWIERSPDFIFNSSDIDSKQNEAFQKRMELVYTYQGAYRMLFRNIHMQIVDAAISNSTGFSKMKFSASMIPKILKSKTDRDIILPEEVISWVKAERMRFIAKTERNRQVDEWINTFLILMVLSSFGSLITLTRTFIDKSIHETPNGENKGYQPLTVAKYIYKPLYGFLLASAVFIIDIFLHAVISDAPLTNLRHESLYVMALAAGLVSDEVYKAVHAKVMQGLESWSKKDNLEAESQNSQT